MLKRILASIIIGLMSACLFATYASAQTAKDVSEKVIRLHVIANSDSDFDQEIKLKVRDAVVKKTGEYFISAADTETAREIALRHLSEIEETAAAVLKENGCDYPVKASLCESYFPTKVYDNGLRLPAGKYEAVRVEIGKAQGKNWWCILYPPLCFPCAAEDSGIKLSDLLDKGQLDFIKNGGNGEFSVKFKLAEWWGIISEKLS